AATVGFLVSVSATVHAAPVQVDGTPTVDLSWGPPSNPDQWNPVPIELTLDGTEFYYEGQQTFTPGGDQITIGYIYGDLDPVLNFGAAITDFGAPSVFGFVF